MRIIIIAVIERELARSSNLLPRKVCSTYIIMKWRNRTKGFEVNFQDFPVILFLTGIDMMINHKENSVYTFSVIC